MFLNHNRPRLAGLFAFCFGLVLALGAVGAAAANEIVVLRSGNAAMGLPDPLINVLVGSGAAPLDSVPFTSTHFDAACSVRSAFVCQPHGAWASSLPCDPLAKWVGIDPVATPASALYCQGFNLETCCIEKATLSFCWTADDVLGDAFSGGPNPDGVYLNGVAVSPSINGGNYAAQTVVLSADVTGLVYCGANRLEVYNRDLGFIVSGIMYSATIEVTPCSTPTENSTWGVIKNQYR